MKMQPGGPNAKRILNPDGSIIGFALKLANDRWAPFDSRERRLVEISVSFQTPNEVLKFFKAAAAGLEGGDA
ncbi:hypothetical protein [Rhizobium lusitanum]|uniref:hypothetical protein n=1 Tax=Rhizobium lusitanum TaxID=293958 RepID=UPI00195A0A46|nr:hypothetical protein [Rhizobium lusitanum]MBM7046091.1 hypothetical protein [Rhizobium lusitanum]